MIMPGNGVTGVNGVQKTGAVKTAAADGGTDTNPVHKDMQDCLSKLLNLGEKGSSLAEVVKNALGHNA